MRLGKVLWDFSRSILSFHLALLTSGTASAEFIRDGYFQSLSPEDSQVEEQVVQQEGLFPPQLTTTTGTLRERIFNRELTLELRSKYVEKFGYIDTDSVNFAAERFTDLRDNRGPMEDIARHNSERSAYAEYFVKRITEYHVDKYFQSDPQLRPLYEAKERINNFNVEVAEETRMRMGYALADNSAELVISSPKTEAKVRIEMGTRANTSTNPADNWISFGRKLSNTLYLISSYAINDGLAALELRRQSSPSLTTSWKSSTTTTASGHTPRQTFFGYALQLGF